MAATILAFAQAGAVFNRAIHLGSTGAVVEDTQTVQAALQAKVAGDQSNGARPARSQSIVADLDPRLIAANTAGDGGGVYGSVAASQFALGSLHPGAVDGPQAQATLVALAMADGAAGLRVVAKGFAPGMLVSINTIGDGSIEAGSVHADLKQQTAALPGNERRAGR